MYCSNCGMKFPDSAYRCPNCGAEPANAAQAEAARTEYTNLEPVQAEPVFSERVQAERSSPAGDAAARGDVSRKVENHLVKSIIATICCCMPFGVVSIVYSAKVGPLLQANNIDAALEASKKANMWGNLSIGVGILVQALWLILYSTVFMDTIKDGSFGGYFN